MEDLRLDNCGDLLIEDGDFVLVDGTAQILQQALITLQTELGEYFYDTNYGTPWISKIFQKRISEAHIKYLIRKALDAVPNIKQITEIAINKFDHLTRSVEIFISYKPIDNEEITTFTYRGLGNASETCEIDYNFPLYLGAELPLLWVDMFGLTNVNDIVNKARGIGTFYLSGIIPCYLQQYSQLASNKTTLRLLNPNGNDNLGYLRCKDMPGFRPDSSWSMIFVINPITKDSTEQTEQFICSIDQTDGIDDTLGMTVEMRHSDGRLYFCTYDGGYLPINRVTTISGPSNLSYESKRILFVIYDRDKQWEEPTEDHLFIYENNELVASGKLPYSFNVRASEGDIEIGGSNWQINADFGEAIFYKNVITEEQRLALYNWLIQKWEF